MITPSVPPEIFEILHALRYSKYKSPDLANAGEEMT